MLGRRLYGGLLEVCSNCPAQYAFLRPASSNLHHTFPHFQNHSGSHFTFLGGQPSFLDYPNLVISIFTKKTSSSQTPTPPTSTRITVSYCWCISFQLARITFPKAPTSTVWFSLMPKDTFQNTTSCLSFCHRLLGCLKQVTICLRRVSICGSFSLNSHYNSLYQYRTSQYITLHHIAPLPFLPNRKFGMRARCSFSWCTYILMYHVFVKKRK